MVELTLSSVRGFPQNGPSDPIEYYRRPVVGWLFRERINRGLRMLAGRRFSRGLEIGYGAGALLSHLAPSVDALHGIDLDADPASVTRMLEARGIQATLVRGSVFDMPYETDYFDVVFCFSVLEHLRAYERALGEIYRVLAPGGLLLLGMPAVNKIMEAGFYAIGFKGIEDHHVTTPRQVASCFGRVGFELVRTNHLVLPSRHLPAWVLYFNWLVRKKDTR